MAVKTRWSYKRGGRKAGFHCTIEEYIKFLLIVSYEFVHGVKAAKTDTVKPRLMRPSLGHKILVVITRWSH